MNPDHYLSLAGECAAELVRLRSRFVATAAATEQPADAQAFIKRVAAGHPQASHRCWAYRTGFPDAPQEHCSDAGEPPGTAGRPILTALQQAGLWNATLVVCRYFGGTKLGIRGLIEAYRAAAAKTIAGVRPVPRQPMASLRLTLAYAQFAALSRMVEELGGTLSETAFSDRVACTAFVPRRACERFAAEAGALGAQCALLNNPGAPPSNQ